MKYLATLSVLYTVVALWPVPYTYQREANNPLQGYCAVAKMDYQKTGIIGGNLKELCNI